ncbi:MAG: toxin-antitoxin system, antitoxin component, Xre family protein [Nitrospirae bacterium]|nr:toxin-antitoxin system, antitoxin component, Xre family protein [Nitrospirota bacterium]MBF0592777.1 toxin-antitoxin system, antitoxin component, Xre family protein [Nitrospirota bacterium]
MTVKEIIKEEIDRLSEDTLVEVLDFIRFLEVKMERDMLVKGSQRLSEASFQKIWDNEEDSVYDSL